MTAADTGGIGTGAGAGPGPVNFRLDDRTALVTGSARGLGLEMARGLAGAGARVVLNGRDPAALAAAAERLRAGGGYDVTTAAFDVTDRPATEHAVEEPGDLDILVDNVGHRDRRGVAEMSPQELHALLDTDLTSAHAPSQTVARGLAARGVPGRVVNLSSVMGQLGRTGDVGYATAKAGLDGLTRALADDSARAGRPSTRSRRAPSPPRPTPSRRPTPTGNAGCAPVPRRAAGAGRRRSPSSSSWRATRRPSSPGGPSRWTMG